MTTKSKVWVAINILWVALFGGTLLIPAVQNWLYCTPEGFIQRALVYAIPWLVLYWLIGLTIENDAFGTSLTRRDLFEKLEIEYSPRFGYAPLQELKTAFWGICEIRRILSLLVSRINEIGDEEALLLFIRRSEHTQEAVAACEMLSVLANEIAVTWKSLGEIFKENELHLLMGGTIDKDDLPKEVFSRIPSAQANIDGILSAANSLYKDYNRLLTGLWSMVADPSKLVVQKE